MLWSWNAGNRRHVPSCWKRSATILIYKKGDTSDPSNFRPITLQPVLYKILATIIRKRMFEFLDQNKLVDKKFQKGFWSGIDGVGEHTETLTHVIRDSKRHQRGLVVTLLDLKNAFWEVHYDLIRAALQYHHLPDLFTHLFNSIYQGAVTAVTSNREWTNFIRGQEGSSTRWPMFASLVQLSVLICWCRHWPNRSSKIWVTYGVLNNQLMNLPGYSSPTMRQSSPTVPKILNSFWTFLLRGANGHKWQSD